MSFTHAPQFHLSPCPSPHICPPPLQPLPPRDRVFLHSLGWPRTGQVSSWWHQTHRDLSAPCVPGLKQVLPHPVSISFEEHVTRQLENSVSMEQIQVRESELSGSCLELLDSVLCFLRWSVKFIGYGHLYTKLWKMKQIQMRAELRGGSRCR